MAADAGATEREDPASREVMAAMDKRNLFMGVLPD